MSDITNHFYQVCTSAFWTTRALAYNTSLNYQSTLFVIPIFTSLTRTCDSYTPLSSLPFPIPLCMYKSSEHNFIYFVTTLTFCYIYIAFITTQFSRSFIPAVTRFWNDLPNHVLESVQLQNFKGVANPFLLSRLF